MLSLLSRSPLLDSPDQVRAKITKATTDSLKEIRYDKKRPGIYNLLVIYELITGDSRADIETRFEGKGYADFKEELAESIIEMLRPLQKRYRELASEKGYIESVLNNGETRARPLAEKTLITVKQRTGLG